MLQSLKYQKLLIVIFLVTTGLLVYSCDTKSDNNRKVTSIDDKLKKESLEKVNRYLVNTETIEIDNYIRRHKLDVVKTGSGVRYQIIHPGNGEKTKDGQVVTLKYIVKLITGDIVYSSDKQGPLTFQIGHGGVESGLEEAILNMRNGDEAIIIIPSHLAHGLNGDGNSIPGRSTVIYELKITNLK